MSRRFGRLGLVALTTISVFVGAALLVHWRERSKVHHVAIAAGSSSGGSYLLAQALQTVVRRQYPNVEVVVLETGGTAESLGLLESGRVAMAAAQADVPSAAPHGWSRCCMKTRFS